MPAGFHTKVIRRLYFESVAPVRIASPACHSVFPDVCRFRAVNAERTTGWGCKKMPVAIKLVAKDTCTHWAVDKNPVF
jgi:hypothetical protein